LSEGVLYISYDGMLEPLGQSQVLAYLERLASGRRIHLISFEKAEDWKDEARRDAVRRRIAEAGIEWHPLRYHKSPSAPATAYDIAIGAAQAIAIARRHELGIVHARSYVAAMMALAVKRMTGAKFLFDMRGLWADERVDGGLWPRNGRLYRVAKAQERRFLLAADRVVTLTHASEAEIRSFDYLQGQAPPISVIPTCADLDLFTIQGPPQREPFTLGYVGSFGTWYLLNELLLVFSMVRELKPGARLLIVNRNEHQLIRDKLEQNRTDPSTVEIVAADHHEVPRQIARMSAGTAFIKPAYSKIASAPTKLAEYLGCGVPCIANSGVGDMERILEGNRVGVAMKYFSERPMEFGLGRLFKLMEERDLQQRCRDVAQDLFSLDVGVAAYDNIYRQLANA
jgi:glycosyltransferase involved in cell wall biosynthesis